MGGSEKLQVAATYRYLTSPLLELRVLTFYLKSKNLKTQVHTSSSPVVALPNTFGALWKKIMAPDVKSLPTLFNLTFLAIG